MIQSCKGNWLPYSSVLMLFARAIACKCSHMLVGCLNINAIISSTSRNSTSSLLISYTHSHAVHIILYVSLVEMVP